MSLPPERLQELRQMVHNQVNKAEVLGKIQTCVEQTLSSFQGNTNEAEVIKVLQDEGIVDDILASLKVTNTGPGLCRDIIESSTKTEASSYADSSCSFIRGEPKMKNDKEHLSLAAGKVYILLHVRGGRAFLEHVGTTEGSVLPGHQAHQSMFTLHVFFKDQRFTSQAVPCACEPGIRETFLLTLANGVSEHVSDTSTVLSTADPIRLVLVVQHSSGEVEVVGTGSIGWRKALTTENCKLSLPLELCGYGVESIVTIGMLDILLEVVPKGLVHIEEDTYSTQLKIEENRFNEKERMFLAYAKWWWKEFLQIRPSHNERLVKIFAHDESGKTWPVFAYVHPLQAGRLLDSPRHAARFVSLIAYQKTSSSALGSGGCRSEIWNSMCIFLARRKGDSEDHSVLLCSLLLGFGLQAYVCVGTKGKSQVHSWVMTLGHNGEVTFWESLTGQRFSHQSVDPGSHPGPIQLPRPSHPYRTIGCLFNHTTFLANIQPSDSLVTMQFNLKNPSHWKAMSREAIDGVRQGVAKVLLPPVVLSGGNLDPVLLSTEVETKLRVCLVEHRQELGLNTVWNNALSYILSSALSSYEMERVTGVSMSTVEFQQAVRLAVPEGCTFKAFPIQFIDCNTGKMFASCLKSDVCHEILSCRGDRVEHAVRCSVYPYPENMLAVWVMFAVQYQSVL